MFYVHDVIETGGDPSVRLRIIWVAPDKGWMAVIDTIDPNGWPFRVDANEARSLLASGTWRVEEGQRPICPLDHDLSKLALRRRDQNWRYIEDIVEQVPSVFDRMTRARLVTSAMQIHGKARTTLDDLLRAYFHRGMCKAAITPGFYACGGRGRTKAVAPDSPKRGAPVTAGAPPGVNVTPEMRRLFCQAIDLSFARERRHDMASAHHFCMRRFFMREEDDANTGRLVHVANPPYDVFGLPTERQFRYWVARDNPMEAVIRKRLTPRVYEMTRRPMVGNPTAQALGPASRFQIDATILDVYIRSRKARRLIVGRPTLYVVIDVFSRLIVGIYVGLERPSWIAAMMAIANAATPKVEFCRSIGIEIEPHEWPAQTVPGAIAGDRGEMIKAKVENMLRQFSVLIANAAPYRGDWKGVVEVRFRLLPAIFKPYIPGYVETDFRQRGARDYRLEAELDLDDVYRVIVRSVLYYNNHHVLHDYVRHPGLTEDNVPSIPLELWNWGIANLSGVPRPPPLDRYRFALMPTSEASMTPQGLLFEGRLYTCPKAVREGWFAKARDKRFRVSVSHDKRLTDHVYVHDKGSPSGFDLATLTDRSKNRAGISCWEAAAMDWADKVLHANKRIDQEAARADAEAAIERSIGDGRRKTADVPDERSASAQVGGIRESCASELAGDRPREAEAFRAGMVPDADRAGDVVLFQPAAHSYSLPSLAERRRLEQERRDKAAEAAGRTEGHENA